MFTIAKQNPGFCGNGFKRSLRLIALIIFTLAGPGAALADEVTDWNQHTINVINTTKASAIATARILAIEQAAVFDAVNGIERRFTHIYVKPDGPRRASSRAAAIQAAYATLIRFFPAQRAALDAQREAALAALADEDDEHIKQGIKWGQTVAEEIFAVRCGDGFDAIFPPFTGATESGQWRPTPSANLAAQTPELARMTPFVMNASNQFRPSGPRALTSSQYAADFNEIKALGRDTGSTRTDEQTQIGLFWGDNNQIHWNRIALAAAAQRADSLIDNARLFALLNLAAADATIVAWDAKYHYNHWRPLTAIRLADTDGNNDTAPDATWSPFQTTPNHQEYVSGHSTISGAAARVLAALLGDNVTFTHGSDTLAGVTRTHASFSAAAAEANESRIFTGAHFRSSANDGQTAGAALGNLVVSSLARPRREKENGAEPGYSAQSCLPAITISPDPPLPTGTIGMAYSQTFTHQGGGYLYVSWYIPYGAVLPPGLTLDHDTGVLSGIPTTPGTYNFFVRATSTFNGWCYGERGYSIVVKAATALSLMASVNPVIVGQAFTLTAQVRAQSGGTPTGTVQFSLNGSPVGNPVAVIGGTASLNLTALTPGSNTASASYSGDESFWPSSNNLAVSVFSYRLQDDATGDQLFFNSNGTYLFKHYAGASSFVLSGKGSILSSASPCTVFLEHVTADRNLTAEVNICNQTGTATVDYQGVTYTLSQGN